MSDRAQLTLTIHDCPVDQAAAALAVIRDHGLHLEFADEPDGVLHTKAPYIDVEAALGEEERLASALIEAAPDCSFIAWQDPKYQEPGQLVMHDPALGRFDSCCDAYGHPHVTLEEVFAVAQTCGVAEGRASGAEFLGALLQRLGRPWQIALLRGEQRAIVPSASAHTVAGAHGEPQ